MAHYIHESNIVKHLQEKAFNIACYIQNIGYIRPILNQTPYELWNKGKQNIS